MVREVASHFQYEGVLQKIAPYGNGHINDTYLLTYAVGCMGLIRVILQRINTHVFQKPVEVMENILHITSYLHAKVRAAGGNPYRETLNLIPTKEGKAYYQGADGAYWRSFVFITDAFCYDRVERAEDFYQSALAFGHFQCLLADFPAEKLHETIPGFHDTEKRFADFQKAVSDDEKGRAGQVQKEIEFVLARKKEASFFTGRIRRKELPLRVTHNDTKFNNIMIDSKTGKGICVIDLDTTMPGLAAYDFGDSIRFGASTGAEDERDLSRVRLNLELFETYTKGFIQGCGGKLTKAELELLPMGAKMMTYECGMRFLADYLQGDIYFKTGREGQNLDRARTQFKLVQEMEEHWDKINRIVETEMMISG